MSKAPTPTEMVGVRVVEDVDPYGDARNGGREDPSPTEIVGLRDVEGVDPYGV